MVAFDLLCTESSTGVSQEWLPVDNWNHVEDER